MMYYTELVFLPARARRMPTMSYLSAIAVKGTEGTKATQFVVYGNNPALLKVLVDDHNEMVRIRKQVEEEKKRKK